MYCVASDVTDKLRKHGLAELVQADPCKFEHDTLFRELYKLTLEHRFHHPQISVVTYVRIKSHDFPLSCRLQCSLRVAGLGQPRAGVRLERVLFSLRCATLLQLSDNDVRDARVRTPRLPH